MGIEKIKDLIINSAKKKVEEMIETAKRDLEEEFSKFKKQLDEEYQARLERLKKEIDEEFDRAKVIEISKIEKKKLLKKKEILDEFFEHLKSMMMKDEKSYKKMLITLLKRDVVDGSTVYLNGDDLKKFGKDFEKLIYQDLKLNDVKIEESPINIKGGLIIKSPNFEIDDSIDELVDSFREEKEIEIAKEIFG
ncbi:MAG: V-type ATP synthase subunit E family protein [Caldisericum sp.]|uniref:V-type ATP synthase subunit E family protein n=1 Tax=Caldisericum sp. TaxID=2499687 RepID=UPI003D12004F